MAAIAPNHDLLDMADSFQQVSDQARRLAAAPPNNVVPDWAQQILNGQALIQQQMGGLATQQQLWGLQQQVGAVQQQVAGLQQQIVQSECAVGLLSSGKTIINLARAVEAGRVSCCSGSIPCC
jgi:hypothetical protein